MSAQHELSPAAPATTTGKDRIELVATALLAIAAVATAWSSYQVNRWNGEQTRQSGHTNALRIQAARSQSLADDQKQVDVATFVQWVDAAAVGDQRLQDFYVTRFRPEFKTAFAAWTATNPFENPAAPLTPFAMPEYQLAADADTKQLDAAAERSSAQRDEYLQRSANYVLAVVFFAVVLFFAGMSTKLTSRRARMVLLGTGVAMFVGTAIWVATFKIVLNI